MIHLTEDDVGRLKSRDMAFIVDVTHEEIIRAVEESRAYWVDECLQKPFRWHDNDYYFTHSESLVIATHLYKPQTYRLTEYWQKKIKERLEYEYKRMCNPELRKLGKV